MHMQSSNSAHHIRFQCQGSAHCNAAFLLFNNAGIPCHQSLVAARLALIMCGCPAAVVLLTPGISPPQLQGAGNHTQRDKQWGPQI